MKLKFSFALFVTLIFAAGISQAQMRIAFIDATKILKRMPEAVDAETRLNQMVSQWNKEVGDMENELKRKRDDFERKKLIMTDAERTAIELDITDLKKRIDDFRQAKYGTSGELYTKQTELMKPAYDKFNKALEEVALDGKYDYVLDRGANDHSILYTNAKFDLSIPVAKKLGLETNDLFNIPLLNNPLNKQQPNNPNPNPNPNNPNMQPYVPPNLPPNQQPPPPPPGVVAPH
jgi:outer membrane protein